MTSGGPLEPPGTEDERGDEEAVTTFESSEQERLRHTTSDVALRHQSSTPT